MKDLLTLFFAFTSIGILSAQTTDTNYALPSEATEVANTVSNTPGYMVMLTEGGMVPSEIKSTCDGKSDGIFKSSTGLSLQHYYDKQQLQQMSGAYASMGGLKSFFIKNMQGGYDNAESGMNPGPILKKSKVEVGELQGAVVSYYTITYGCIQNDNPDATATKIIYNAMLLTDNDYLIITNEIYSANADKARKYAEEIMSKVKALDYGKVN